MNQYFKLISNKLYRKWKNQWKLYIPNELKIELIQEIHQMYGHPGTKKTLQLIKEYFTMDAMCQTISQVVKCCDICPKVQRQWEQTYHWRNSSDTTVTQT